jgi:SAM-dependent methyltransferase
MKRILLGNSQRSDHTAGNVHTRPQPLQFLAMASVQDHYRSLLAKHYTWMTGASFEEKVAEQKLLLETIVEPPESGEPRGLALDLGSGPGFQSIALAQLGFSPVIAVDLSAKLLDELRMHRGDHPIETVEADLATLDEVEIAREAAVAVCMGDTLTHLDSRESVRRLFAAVLRKLAPRGVFAITYRDLSVALTGLDRFIPVRSDDEKIMTCFLEYESEEHVVVNDVVHLRAPQGWSMEKSSYRKLRLPAAWVVEALRDAGFRLRSQSTAGRLALIIAEKP